MNRAYSIEVILYIDREQVHNYTADVWLAATVLYSLLPTDGWSIVFY